VKRARTRSSFHGIDFGAEHNVGILQTHLGASMLGDKFIVTGQNLYLNAVAAHLR
jgi:hypothetical protein